LVSETKNIELEILRQMHGNSQESDNSAAGHVCNHEAMHVKAHMTKQKNGKEEQTRQSNIQVR
jgi:hypothetical protein